MATVTASASRPTSAKRSKAPREGAGALGTVARVEPPLLQLAGDDALPTEAIAELDVRLTNRGVARVGEVGEGAECFVTAIELVGEDRGELAS